MDCVARTDDGSLVYTGYPQSPYGTLAQLVSVPAQLGFPVPDRADPAVVAGHLNPGLSTWLPLQHLAGRAEGATVVVTGATGAAGRLAVQNARALGVPSVIALGRDTDALATLRPLGATGTVTLTGYRTADISAIQAALDDRSPAMVLDPVWGWVAETLLESLIGQGLEEKAGPTRYVHLGAAGGSTAAVPGAVLRSRPIEIVGSGAGSSPMSVILAQLPRYLAMLADGTLTARVRTFGLADIAAAWEPETSGERHVVLG